MKYLLSSEKRTLVHWATVQFFFSLAQVRCFWRCFCFRSGLVLFLNMSKRGDFWCTDSSFSSLLVKLSQVFESTLLDSILKLASSLLLVHIFLPNFFLRVNFAFNMLWYSTPWTATLFSNDPLCGGCQWSSSEPLPSQQCSPLLWFQRTRDTQNLYCMDGHLLKLN